MPKIPKVDFPKLKSPKKQKKIIHQSYPLHTTATVLKASGLEIFQNFGPFLGFFFAGFPAEWDLGNWASDF